MIEATVHERMCAEHSTNLDFPSDGLTPPSTKNAVEPEPTLPAQWEASLAPPLASLSLLKNADLAFRASSSVNANHGSLNHTYAIAR